MQYVLLVILWIGWCGLHSGLISPGVTESLRKRFPNLFRYYRIFFNLFSVVTLVPVLVYSASLRTAPLVAWEGPWVIVPILLGAAALYFFAAGARRYDFGRFIGLRQLKDQKSCGALTDDGSLDTGGVLSMVRHPWYAGGILVVWARPLDVAAVLTNLVLSGYFVAGALLEERKLISQFGRQYRDYQRQVSMLFPVKWLRARLSGR